MMGFQCTKLIHAGNDKVNTQLSITARISTTINDRLSDKTVKYQPL